MHYGVYHGQWLEFSCIVDSGCKEGEVRLAGGSVTAGRVEICLSGVWGVVCDDSWDVHDARVTCRQLGLPFECKCYILPKLYIADVLTLTVPKAPVSSVYYGKGEGPVLLSNLHCNGDEEYLNNCTHDGVGRHFCQRSEVANVVCSNGKTKHPPICVKFK